MQIPTEDTEVAPSGAHRLSEDEFLVVGLGASAGGVEALESLFSMMPADPGVAIVVVQQISPKFESLIPQIISRRTALPVASAQDGDTIRPNQVYVLPAGKEIILSDGKLRLKDRPSTNQGTSTIDQFFRSLAQDFRHRAVSVVLSGTGSDGSRGVLNVHEAGGYVIVQSETSAKFNGMPRAAADSGIADAVVPVDEIPSVITRLNKALRRDDHSAGVLSHLGGGVGEILQLLRKNFSIDFNQYKGSMIKRRVERRLMLSDDSHLDMSAYLSRLDRDPEELNSLFSDLLIGVTQFFRDPEAFEHLRVRILPDLLRSKVDSGVFRAWVAPTATGEEAYSLAMLIDEIIQQNDLRLEVKIFATDAHQRSIEFASRAVYPSSSLANVSPQHIERYFRESDDGFHVCRHLRKMVVFAEHNVLSDAPFTGLDFISCRNLLIYLKPAAQERVLSLFNFGLNESGLLFLGPSEGVGELGSAFETINEKWRFYSKADNVRASHLQLNTNTIARPTRQTRETETPATSSLIDTYDQLIDSFIPPSLLVTSEMEIAHIFAGGSQFLSMREGRPTQDVLQMLPDTLRIAVANGIKRCQGQGDAVVYAGLQCEIGGVSNRYRVTIRPIRNRRKSRTDFLISFVDSEVQLDAQNETALPADSVNLERVRTLETELRDTRESLHASIQELRSANEEMQSTNEELIASNEELQSTNEELHSVNEELYTVNSEHQRKITELTELTDDMENLLDSIRVDTIFLDRHLKLRRFTLGIARTFRLIPQDVGRRIDSFNHDLQNPDLVADIQSVLDSEQPIEKDVQDTSGAWYLMRLLPYTSRGRVDGVLLTLIDITPIKATEQRLAELSEIVEVSDDAIFRVDSNSMIRTWNRGATELYGHDADTIIGRSINALVTNQVDRRRLEGAIDGSTKGNPLRHVYMQHSKSNGEFIDVAITISPIATLTGQPGGASIVIRDISAQKRAQEEVQNALRRRDEFLAMLSHELRNPLAAILNAESLLREEDVDEATAAEAREVAQTQLRHLTRLLDDLLDVARITNEKLTLQMEVIDLRKSMMEATECVQHQLEEKSQQLFVESPSEPVLVFADVGRLQQAQVNLLVNASKYTPTGGEIRFSLHVDDSDRAVLTVADDGIGVSDELSQTIFDLFVQSDQSLDRSQGGMGLGLPLVKMIATAHGGDVALENKPSGSGSKFRIRLPLTKRPPTETEAAPPATLTQKKLLLIEDNDGIRNMLARSLQLKGLDVETAPNATTGLSTLNRFEPEIAVVDIGLPDIDGYEVARRIRQLPTGHDVLLVAVTGYGRAEDKAKALDAGFDAHMVKPVDPTTLVTMLAGLERTHQPDG